MLHKAMPELHCKHLLCLGEVIGGRYRRGLHHVSNLTECDDQSVFVMYGEYRIPEKDTYKHVENVNTNNISDVSICLFLLPISHSHALNIVTFVAPC